MSRNEFIDLLQKCFFGERNAFNAIVSFFDELQNLCNSQYIACEKLKKQLVEKDKVIKEVIRTMKSCQKKYGYILDDVIYKLESVDK